MIGTSNNKEILGPVVVMAELWIEIRGRRLTKIDISVVENTHLHLLMVLDDKQNTDQETQLELLSSVRHQATMIDLVVLRNKLMVSNLKQNQKSTMTFKNIYILQVHRIAMQGKETVMEQHLKPSTDMINVEAHQLDILMISKVYQPNGVKVFKLQAEMWIRWIEVTSNLKVESNSTVKRMVKQLQMEGMTHMQEEMLEINKLSLNCLANKQDSLDHLMSNLPEALAEKEKLQINYNRDIKGDKLKMTDMEAMVVHNNISMMLNMEETEVLNRIDEKNLTTGIQNI